MFALLILILVARACAQLMAPVHFSDSKKMTPEQFRKIPDDPYSDPAGDIPEVPPGRLLPPADIKIPDGPGILPRDRYLNNNQKYGMTKSQEESELESHMWIDFPRLHDHLIQQQSKHEAATRKPFRKKIDQPVSAVSQLSQFDKKIYQQKLDQFEPNKFGLESDNIFLELNKTFTKHSIVWTTCDEFKNPSQPFDPHDLIDFEWIPFYIWSKEKATMATVHRFTVPTKKQVYDYHTKFALYMNRTVDWNKPKLHLDEDLGEHQALLIAADETGLFYCRWNTEVSEFVQRNKITLKSLTLRLKIVGFYLAIMFCEEKEAKIMARNSHLPQTNKEKREAAKVLKFKGIGRPVSRDIEYERERSRINQERMEYAKFRAGFPGRSATEDRPIGRRHKERVMDIQEGFIPPGPVL